MRRRSYPDHLTRDLHRAVAQATWLAGLTSIDSGRHALGQAYYAQALHLAHQSGDRVYAANILAEMSRTTMDVANASGNVAANGRHAVALARSAVHVAGERATPGFKAWLHAMEARALAMVGDRHAVDEAVLRARRSFDGADGNEPEWFGFYGEADFLADVGQCLRDVGRPRHGLAMLERAAAALPEHRVTARLKTQIHIAAAHLAMGDIRTAGEVVAGVLDATQVISSNRIVDRVRSLRGHAHGAGPGRAAREFDERVAAFLASNRA